MLERWSDREMSTTDPEPTEEELRAAYEAEIKKIRVEHLLLENIVSIVNLGMRRTGIAAGTAEERDPAQVQLAIETVRAVLPLLERVAPAQVGPIRDALSQLQLAYVKIGGGMPAGASSEPAAGPAGGPEPRPAGPAGGPTPPPTGPAQPEQPKPGEPGPAQRSGRLWVPGQ
jgi:hypothetical protein